MSLLAEGIVRNDDAGHHSSRDSRDRDAPRNSWSVCLLINTVAPGAAAPLHKHTVEEIMLVLDGTVWVHIEDERYTVGPQHTVIIPAETPHAWGNAGPNVAKLLWAFGGPDPFRDSTYFEGVPPASAPLETSQR